MTISPAVVVEFFQRANESKTERRGAACRVICLGLWCVCAYTSKRTSEVYLCENTKRQATTTRTKQIDRKAAAVSLFYSLLIAPAQTTKIEA